MPVLIFLLGREAALFCFSKSTSLPQRETQTVEGGGVVVACVSACAPDCVCGCNIVCLSASVCQISPWYSANISNGCSEMSVCVVHVAWQNVQVD